MTDLARRAAELDAADPLAEHAERFVRSGDVVAYLDGNSLGRPLRTLRERYGDFIERDWGERLIRAWDEQWMRRPFDLGDRIGALVGAAPGQVFVGDSTTVLLYKLARAAVDAQAEHGRTEIVIDDDNFPSDRFIVEGIAAERGCTIRWIEADPAAGVTVEQVEEAVGERTALVLLSHVAYRSGFVADVAGITRAAHDAGALVLWDLCHSAGVIPVGLDEHGVDLAVGCSYKYLNGGPGAPAFGYVRADLHERLAQPIQGWMGAADVFAMGPRFEPATGLGRFLSGTPPVLATVALEAMVELVEAVGIDAVRAKSVALTGFAEAALAEHVLPLGARLASPPAGPHRGSHLTVTHPSFREVNARLWERGVIGDFRAPDGIRIGLSPLSTTFAEVELGVAALGEELRRALR
ncbi:aminotransferase class V-fold PLP-dependent enzyme [Agrococcus sp. Marseille-Q4369]|uniref:kynureninase n=1 Tax=Agrococcus sp. Marseille-Q4369 TaxID=2810513 RepID=UPI001B8C8B6F|nr:aminotransferase class V-fold PLP-dependent enzyme [Agrococcus sp. Marseille-Q4369]QUW19580.1 aminotransferase class V-fold PLP-dependent enzyme [Agrococcus sp. Marseille-Q4369]